MEGARGFIHLGQIAPATTRQSALSSGAANDREGSVIMSTQEATETASAMSDTSIGWIGLGKMGGAMARHLLSATGRLILTEPNRVNLVPLIAAGGEEARSLADHSRCDLVFSTIPNDSALRAIVFGEDGAEGLATALRPGAAFVEMSTVSPDCSREVADALAKRGVLYLRAPISGSTAMAESASLTFLTSGSGEAWKKALPFMRVMSAKQFYLGEADEARFMKLVLNAMVGATSAVVAEAIALGANGGLSREAMMDVICSSAVSSPLLQYKRDAIVRNDFTPAFSVTQMIKDFSLITDAGRYAGVPLVVIDLILDRYRAAAKAGHGDEDFFALVDWVAAIGRSGD